MLICTDEGEEDVDRRFAITFAHLNTYATNTFTRNEFANVFEAELLEFSKYSALKRMFASTVQSTFNIVAIEAISPTVCTRRVLKLLAPRQTIDHRNCLPIFSDNRRKK